MMDRESQLNDTFCNILFLSREGCYNDTTLVCKNGAKFQVNSFLLAATSHVIRNIQPILENCEDQVMISVPDVEKSELETFFSDLYSQQSNVLLGETMSYLLHPDCISNTLKDERDDEEDEDGMNIDFTDLDPLVDETKECLKEELHDDTSSEIKEDISEKDVNYKCTKYGKEQKSLYKHKLHMTDHLNRERNHCKSKEEREKVKKKEKRFELKKKKKKESRHMSQLENESYNCRYDGCEAKYFRIFYRNSHETREHGGIFKGETESEEMISTHRACEVCGELIIRGRLWAHMRKHKPKNKQFCEQCGKWLMEITFSSHACLKKRPAKVCNICGETFVNLDLHISNIHSEEIKRKCEICGNMVNESKFSRHVENHEKQFVCPHCGKKVKKLADHISKMHTSDDMKKIQCPDCGKGFIKEVEYKNHRISVHEKTYPHKCRYENCDAKYNDASNRNCHEKKKHGRVFKLGTPGRRGMGSRH